MKNNADACIEALISEGVDHFFLVVGGNAMYLNEAIRASGIKYTIFHHEQSAAMAAEAYARQSSKLAVCVSTSGPGASNLITGVAGAFLDSAPVMFISGQSKSSELVSDEMGSGVRQFGTFELPIKKMLLPIVKDAIMFNAKDDIVVSTLELAHLATTGRPGPVYLEFPLDLQSKQYLQESVTKAKENLDIDHLDGRVVTKDTLIKVHTLLLDLAKASKPIILAGNGIRSSDAVELFMKLVNKLEIPVLTTQIAKDLIPYSDPFFVGHPGIRGDRPGNLCLQESDLIVTIGSSLQQQSIGYDAGRFAQKAKKYVVDFEKSVSSKNLSLGETVFIDVSIPEFILCILESLATNEYNLPDYCSWREANQKRKRLLAVELEPHEQLPGKINLYNFVNILGKNSSSGDVFVSDAGLCYFVLGQALLLKEGQRYIVSGGLGAMGYALPAGIGASISNNAHTYCVTGDGSAQFNIQELATLSEVKTNLVVFIINNNGYASIRNTQKSFFEGNFIGSSQESGIRMPDWGLIASAYGLPFTKIETFEDLETRIREIMGIEGPILVEVMCQENQILMPSIQSRRNLEGVLVSDDLSEMWPNEPNQKNIDAFN